jgi:hypothetical protein
MLMPSVCLCVDFQHRPIRVLIAAALASCLGTAPAVAQLDTEPSNNAAAGANVLSLSAGMATTNMAGLAGPGNDVDFFSVTLGPDDVLLGMVTPLAGLPQGYTTPDMAVSVMQGGIPITYSDDDFAGQLPDIDDGLGSLFRVISTTASPYEIGISGYLDFEFDGAQTGDGHTEVGAYSMTLARINRFANGGGFADTDATNSVLAGADLISIGATGATVAISQMQDNDIDYYALNLTSGQMLSVMTAPIDDLPSSFNFPDTLIRLVDANGVPLVTNDDAGDDGWYDPNPDLGSDNPVDASGAGAWGSAFRALIPADGVYYIGVTGYGDDNFLGEHEEFGRYALLVGVANLAPQPEEPGDFNHDGNFDAADYVLWRKHLGSLYSTNDYDDWRENFGNPPAGSGAQLEGVPEPATLALVCFAAIAALLRRRSR